MQNEEFSNPNTKTNSTFVAFVVVNGWAIWTGNPPKMGHWQISTWKWNHVVLFRGLRRSPGTQFFKSRHRKNSVRGKVIRIGACEVYKWVGERVGYGLITKGKVGMGRRSSLSFLSSRCHASIFSFSSRLGRRVFLSLHGPARSINCFHVCRQRVLTELTEQEVGLGPPLSHCFGRWFCCMVFLLNKPALLSNH